MTATLMNAIGESSGPGGRAHRGVVLVIVLAVLMLLAMVGTVFVTFSSIEKRIATNFTDDVRAKLLAQSGLEFAIAMTERDIGNPGQNRPYLYWGDQDKEDPPPTDPDYPTAPNPSFALEEATNPSYAIDAGSIGDATYDPKTSADPTPHQITIDGKKRGLSMVMSTGTYGKNSDIAVLRVMNTQSQIYLNDGIHENDLVFRPVTENMRRILNSLGEIVDVDGLGDTIIYNRPVEGWATKDELQTLFTDSEYASFKNLVTVHAWIDKNVALPVPLSSDSTVLDQYPDHYQPAPAGHLWRGYPHVFRRGRGVDFKGIPLSGELQFSPAVIADSTDTRLYGMDELNPTWIEVTQRAPVSINDAPRDVLIALLNDLEGFFWLEGRKYFPNTNGPSEVLGGQWGGYQWISVHMTHSPDDGAIPREGGAWRDEGDHLGKLFTTMKIVYIPPTTTTNSDEVSANMIADEIIACRKRQVSPANVTCDYADQWFGGQFKTWRQFNAFCDNLVEIGAFGDVVASPLGEDLYGDTRVDLFRDYKPEGADQWGNQGESGQVAYPNEDSPYQRHLAAKALADVLKANFNPNLHLNELNPDENLFLFVDKTDLIVNSTEFLLTQGGTYEIESLGRVLRPIGGSDTLTASDNEIIAEKKITARVKIFDMYRETHQKQFTAGTMGDRDGGPMTNNTKSVETGPEPDNGPAPAENEWGGYVALASIGGHGSMNSSGTPEETPQMVTDDTELSRLHGHFAWDDRLHHHVDGGNKHADLSNHSIAGEAVRTFPSPGESALRPYMPTATSAEGGSFRLARSFVRTSNEPVPVLKKHAPLDLRIDGIYSERHSGPAYWLSENVLPNYISANVLQANMVACYWMKTSFMPETTWKSRTFLNLSQSTHSPWGSNLRGPHQFLHSFCPAHDKPPYEDSDAEPPTYAPSAHYYIRTIAPAAFVWGYNEGGVATGTLNHDGHEHGATKKSRLVGHRWSHIILMVKHRGTPKKSDYEIYINGTLLGTLLQDGDLPDETPIPMSHAQTLWDTTYKLDPGWSKRADGFQNSIRLGAPSRRQQTHLGYSVPNVFNLSTATYEDFKSHRMEWPADATFDEFYWWAYDGPSDTSVGIDSAMTLWEKGRYFVPGSIDGEFTSQEINLVTGAVRNLPPATSTSPPGPTGEGGGGGGGNSIPAPDTTSTVRIIGIAWTLLAEDVHEESDPGNPDFGKPIAYDYLDDTPAGAPTQRVVEVEMTFLVNDVAQTPDTPMVDDGYTAVSIDNGSGPEDLILTAGDVLKYKAQFQIHNASPATILIATPVIDDVTIYYTRGVEFLEFQVNP